MSEENAITLQKLKNISKKLETIRHSEDGINLVHLRNDLTIITNQIELAQTDGLWHKTHSNYFSILGCERDEEIHSNFLAWILDPSESHGLGCSFLSRLMEAVFGKTLANLDNSVVSRNIRENEGIPDIVVDNSNLRLLIENKIDSKEGPNQTKKYAAPYEAAQGIKERYFLVYLTPDGKLSASESFLSISYALISRILKDILPKSVEDTYYIIKHFIEHLDLHISDRSN